MRVEEVIEWLKTLPPSIEVLTPGDACYLGGAVWGNTFEIFQPEKHAELQPDRLYIGKC